jgi:hypothetical protein
LPHPRLQRCDRDRWWTAPKIVRGEYDENVERLPFQASEIPAIYRALAPLVATPEGRPKTKENFLSLDEEGRKKGQTRDKIGAFAGMSGRTVEKIVQIEEAVEADPSLRNTSRAPATPS